VAVFVVRKKKLAISFAGAVGNRFLYKSSRVQKWQMFSESDRRGRIFALWWQWLKLATESEYS
jgi:hypothetical protein